MPTGSLIVMGLVDSLRLGKLQFCRDLYSTYSVESWVCQNSRSWASDLNLGIFLSLVIF